MNDGIIERADLDAAVAAGVLKPADAEALLEFIRVSQRAALGADEEQFRFISSFNDIFVTIAIGLLLFAAGALAQLIGGVASGIVVASLSWALAEYFTRKRRMALPSIVLLLTFSLASGGAVASLFEFEGSAALTGGVVTAVAAAGAAWAHWRRFRVPISIAAGAAAGSAAIVFGVGTLMSFAGFVGGADLTAPILLLLTAVCGAAVFALAMQYDISDRVRRTRRTDVAFWLHLLAAPMLVHPAFVALGLFRGSFSIGAAVAVVAVYIALTLLALAIDRRALLVSALGYVIFAIQTLVRKGGGLEIDFAVTALILGLFLVLLSAGWKPIRARVVAFLPDALAKRLPVAA